MRLASFEVATPIGSFTRLGCLVDGELLDVNLAYRCYLATNGRATAAPAIADAVAPPDMLAFLEAGQVADDALDVAVEYVGGLGDDIRRAPGCRLVWGLEEVRLLAPLAMPRTLREFGQFVGHATQGGRRELPDVWYHEPTFWKGNPMTIIGPDDRIPFPRSTSRLDFEIEIACVIGRGGVDIQAADALSHVKGFTIFNDVCARDVQSRELPAMKGPSKSHDFCSVMGPVLVSPDELPDGNLYGRVRVNGVLWTEVTTEDMHFGWSSLIAHASREEPLVPGEVLVSGTLTGGSAIEHFDWRTDGPLLKRGDLIELEIDGIGVLRNVVGEAEHV
jgi:2-keto-4-pentenoate hydratase/2-oxohepta-3-ene-1,7-dioic acid hydratase in catechol pathway